MTVPDVDRADALHDALGRWAEDHARRYPDIGFLEYDPAERPEQRIETSKSPVSSPPGMLDGAMRSLFETTMGPAAAQAIAALNNAGSDGQPSVRDELASALEEHKSVAVLVSHAGGFEDMGVFAGAVAVALERPELIACNGVIVNKVMTRETYKGHPIRDLYRYFANIYWVIPDTESMERWKVDPETGRRLNVATLRALVTDMREGIALTFAPSGSAMRQVRDEEGRTLRLQIPEIAPATEGLISRFNGYICGAVWQDEVRLGPLRAIERRRSGGRQLVAAVLEEMASLTEGLAGLPVEIDA